MLESLEAVESDSAPAGDAFQRARDALAEAERRGVPPEPKAYELFYAYVTGENPVLVQAVDEALSSEDDPNLGAVDRIYAEHVAFGPNSDRFLEVGALLEQEVGDLSASLARRSESDGRFLGELNRARNGMSLFARPGSVKQIVRELQEKSEAYAEQTELFAAELEAARTQMADMHREMKSLRETAYHDHLTGLANRRRFDQVMEQTAEDGGDDAPFCVILADIDHFKRINDTFGHAVGDSVLTQFGRIIRENVRGNDLSARYGGEEFAVILPETNLLGARHVAEKIRQVLASQAFVIAGSRERLGSITASFGVAEHRAGDTPRDLLARSDAALYRAKQNGRNRVTAAEG